MTHAPAKYKLVTFVGEDAHGTRTIQALFPKVADVDSRVKLASVDPKATLSTEMREYVGTVQSKDGKLFVLVNALGAGEYYGSNINADYFEESMLIGLSKTMAGKPVRPDSAYSANYDPGRAPTKRPFGFETFYSAGIYRHHKNKDRTKSYGKVTFATYNHKMHRVELVVEIDRKKAKDLGHQDIVEALDSGKTLAVSMGCRVPYDVCSICGTKSKNNDDRCIHMISMKNQILDDGRKVFVYNPWPNFFDLSFVVIGADRISFAMMKVASAGLMTGLVADEFGGDSCDRAAEYGLEKQAALITLRGSLGGFTKQATIVKWIPGFAEKLSPIISKLDKTLPFDHLRQMAGHPMPRVLGSTAAAGIVLKPVEYQTIILIKIRKPNLAQRMYEQRQVFSPTSGMDRTVKFGKEDYHRVIREILGALTRKRSGLSGILEKRAEARQLHPETYETVENTELLNAVARAYNGYRRDLLEKTAEIAEYALTEDTGLLAELYGDVLDEAFTPGLDKTAGVPTSLIAAVPLAFLAGAHLGKSRDEQGPLKTFVKKHPVLASSILAGLVRLGTKLYATGTMGAQLERVLNKGL